MEDVETIEGISPAVVEDTIENEADRTSESGHRRPPPEGGYNAWTFGSGPLGTGESCGAQRPRPILSSRRWAHVALGDSHGLGASAAGELFSWGLGERGQCGHGDTESIPAPVRVEATEARRVLAVAAGFEHSACLFDTGEVATFGSHEFGQCGHGDAPLRVTSPRLVRSLRAQSVLLVACGSAHTLAVTGGGVLMAWGQNCYGQLGLGDTLDRATPTAVGGALRGRPVVGAAGGEAHSVALLLSGEAFTWGRAAGGALGLGAAAVTSEGASGRSLYDDDGCWGKAADGVPRASGGGIMHGHVYAALREMGIDRGIALQAAGATASIEAAVEWAFSQQQGGGAKPGSGRRSPGAAAGNGSTTKPGTAAGSDSNSGGSSGTTPGDVQREGQGRTPGPPKSPRAGLVLRPQRCELRGRCFFVAAGAKHTACLVSSPSEVFTFGCGSQGQLGHGGTGDEASPRAVARLSGIAMRSAALGSAHSLFVTCQGRVLACGAGEEGQLGDGDGRDKLLPVDVLVPSSVTEATEAVGHPRAVGVAAGGYCSGLIVFSDDEDRLRRVGLGCSWATGLRSIERLEAALRAWEAAGGKQGGSSGAPARGEACRVALPLLDSTFGSVAALTLGFCSRCDEQAADETHIAAPEPGGTWTLDARRAEAAYCSTLALALESPAAIELLYAALGRAAAEAATGFGVVPGSASSTAAERHAAPEQALAVLAALQCPLMGDARFASGLAPPLCAALAAATRVPRLRSQLRRAVGAMPLSLLASRLVRPLHTFVAADIASRLATSPASCDAIRCLALLEGANEAARRAGAEALPFEEFYNSFVSEHFNAAEDYALWRGGAAPFAFCAFPFLLSPAAKSRLLRHEALCSMQASVQAARVEQLLAMFTGDRETAGTSSGQTVGVVRRPGRPPRRPPPPPGALPLGAPNWLRFLAGEPVNPLSAEEAYEEPGPPPQWEGLAAGAPPPPGDCGVPETHPDLCILRIRRAHLVADALDEVARQRPEDLLKPLRVHFIGEEGVDGGGLRKEFLQLLVASLASPLYGLFCELPDTRLQWLQEGSLESEPEWLLVGAVLGLAIYNGVLLELRLPPAFWMKLLGQPVGLVQLADMQPEVAASLRALLKHDPERDGGSVQDVFCLTWEVETHLYGAVVRTPLCEGGGDVPVTEANRAEFVEAYVRWRLEGSIAAQFEPLQRGFLMLCGGPALELLRPQELEALVCGSPVLDFAALKAAAVYKGGFGPEHPTVRALWAALDGFSLAERKRFLSFVTGSDRAPIGGLGCLPIVIQRDCCDDPAGRLPTSHTCFNTLVIPEYPFSSMLAERLRVAVDNGLGGFYIE